MTITAETVAARRQEVARMRQDRATIRGIARALGVARSTVYRDIEAIARDTPTAPDQPEGTAVPDTDETPGTPVPPTSGTPAERPGTPAPVSLVLAADPTLLDDLAVLTRTGMRPDRAIRMAVHLMAGAYRDAWTAGLYPPTATPRIDRINVAPYQPPAPRSQ